MAEGGVKQQIKKKIKHKCRRFGCFKKFLFISNGSHL
jgi:rRNA maturation endonuclease Nob1